jgi:hypothetical protein
VPQKKKQQLLFSRSEVEWLTGSLRTIRGRIHDNVMKLPLRADVSSLTA